MSQTSGKITVYLHQLIWADPVIRKPLKKRLPPSIYIRISVAKNMPPSIFRLEFLCFFETVLIIPDFALGAVARRIKPQRNAKLERF